MRLNKFNRFLQKYSQAIESFVPYTGSLKTVFFVESMTERETSKKLSQLISEGVKFTSVNLASKNQLNNIGLALDNEEDFFVFEKPTTYTKPALIPI